MNLSISASNNYYVSSVNQQKVEKNEITEVGKLIETKKEPTTVYSDKGIDSDCVIWVTNDTAQKIEIKDFLPFGGNEASQEWTGIEYEAKEILKNLIDSFKKPNPFGNSNLEKEVDNSTELLQKQETEENLLDNKNKNPWMGLPPTWDAHSYIQYCIKTGEEVNEDRLKELLSKESKKTYTTENDTNNIYFNSNDDVINTEKNLEEIRNKMIR